jgi:ferredoxin
VRRHEGKALLCVFQPSWFRNAVPFTDRLEHKWRKKLVALLVTLPIFARSKTKDIKTMAEIANKYPENVTGGFYVDDQCIDCDLCRETAPANFTRNDDGGHSYVYKQPENDAETALCKEAMEGCPVEAIGSNGAE